MSAPVLPREHEEYAALAVAWAIDALEPADQAKFEAHREGCADCEATVTGALRVAVELAYGVPDVAPPPSLRLRLLAAATPRPPVQGMSPEDARDPNAGIRNAGIPDHDTPDHDIPADSTPGFGDPRIGDPRIGDPRIDSTGIGDPGIGGTGIGDPRIGGPRIGGPRIDSTRIDSTRIDSTRIDSTRIDSTRIDSTRIDSTGIGGTGIGGTVGTNGPRIGGTGIGGSAGRRRGRGRHTAGDDQDSGGADRRARPVGATRADGSRPAPTRRKPAGVLAAAVLAAAGLVGVSAGATWQITRPAPVAAPVAAADRVATLTSPQDERAIATVITEDDRVDVVTDALPANAGRGTSFFLWGVPAGGSGTPQVVGSFDVTADGLRSYPVRVTRSPADYPVLAVSEEPAGSTPTTPGAVLARGALR